MYSNNEDLLKKYDEKTRKGYPLGEVKQDLIELGYTNDQAEQFLVQLGNLINEKVANKEVHLMRIAVLILMACSVVLYFAGYKKVWVFIIVGSVWLIIEFLLMKLRSKNDI